MGQRIVLAVDCEPILGGEDWDGEVEEAKAGESKLERVVLK